MKPDSFRIDIVYRCPECNDKHFYDSEEVKHGARLLCCGKVIKLDKISNINTIPEFGDSVEKKAIKTLKELGFTKKQIKKADIKNNSVNGFVKDFLSIQ